MIFKTLPCSFRFFKISSVTVAVRLAIILYALGKHPTRGFLLVTAKVKRLSIYNYRYLILLGQALILRRFFLRPLTCLGKVYLRYSVNHLFIWIACSLNDQQPFRMSPQRRVFRPPPYPNLSTARKVFLPSSRRASKSPLKNSIIVRTRLPGVWRPDKPA